MNPKIYNELKLHNNMITTAQVVALGFSKSLLTKYLKGNLLERSRHGVYILSDTVEDDMYTLSLSSPQIIFSHDTALFLNGLSDRTPFCHSVTIPSNKTVPPSIKDKCNFYYIKPDLHQLGVIEKKTTLGNIVRCYNAERTICDILRSRNRLDEETVISSIKNYVASAAKDLSLLAMYAEQFRVGKILKNYMEVLL
ncbi:type IV toxin-antitoxin system AbiEi family antitoxin domain-containing protein [Pectinatus frisingensis]|uniref:type IV toxin-antitoxin system AbiEi family antitoxin domain-containing protein n=1 Tax=Pectinatus frisingensis TaxID=865 RepID=UPI0018C823F5|nr:type IV toxin-antitoxin system AbiEi family antitoxin domain-containing protein [Pectinatus frisingensis]